MNECDCTRGGPCNIVSLCRLDNAVEDAVSESKYLIDDLRRALQKIATANNGEDCAVLIAKQALE